VRAKVVLISYSKKTMLLFQLLILTSLLSSVLALSLDTYVKQIFFIRLKYIQYIQFLVKNLMFLLQFCVEFYITLVLYNKMHFLGH